MFFYFEIRYENPHDGVEKFIEFESPTLDAIQAWNDAMNYAMEEWKKLFAENKYWVLKEIRDNVRR